MSLLSHVHHGTGNGGSSALLAFTSVPPLGDYYQELMSSLITYGVFSALRAFTGVPYLGDYYQKLYEQSYKLWSFLCTASIHYICSVPPFGDYYIYQELMSSLMIIILWSFLCYGLTTDGKC